MVTVTTWTQDYPPLPGSADAAAQMADTVVAEHLPRRRRDAAPLVRALIGAALAKTSHSLNLKTVVDDEPFRARFELHYRNDIETSDPLGVHQAVSRLADAYGEQRTRDGRMIYAELWDRA